MQRMQEEMREIFEALTDQNKEIMILVARGIKAVQDTEMKREEMEECQR